MQKIENHLKIHTIRDNYPFWAKRFQEIDTGNAYLSLRVWTGKPYRSKQKEVFRYEKTDGIGLQMLRARFNGGLLIRNEPVTRETLAKNDGLLIQDFKDWFRGYGDHEFAVIHFTNFRYNR